MACYNPRATCHIAGCKNSIRHIENYIFLFLNVVFALTSGSFRIVFDTLVRQEARLSQRGRVMLRVIEYFAKSLKVVRNDTLQ